MPVPSARVALVCSAHGFGHVARQLATGTALRARGADVTVITGAPAGLVHETLPGARVLQRRVDVGISQPDSLTEDLPHTLRLLDRRCDDPAIDSLSAVLAGFDRVLVDIAPPALEAARRAGVPCLAVGNFDWPWVYRHYPELADTAGRLAAWQAPHPAVQLAPGPGLSGFASVTPMGLLGRTAPAHRVVGPGQKAVLVSFGGFGLAGMDRALPRIPGVTWVLAPPTPRLERDDVAWVEGVPYPALVAGADAVFTKPGYGILAECVLAGTPMVWIPRGAFPEAPFLAAAMDHRGDIALDAHPREPDFAGSLADALERLWQAPPPDPVEDDTAARLADHLLG